MTTASTVPLGRRLTAALDTGQHPATSQTLLAGQTCGDCAHLKIQHRADDAIRTKCALAVYRRGGPNLPAATPACALYTIRNTP